MTDAPDDIVPLRHYGRWASGVAALAVAALVVRAFARAAIDWPIVGEFLFAPVLLAGLGQTLVITALAMLIGTGLGVLFAVMRLSANPVTRTVAAVYIWLFRGTPVYLQLLLWFNLALVVPVVDVGFYRAEMVEVMTPFLAALLGLGINEGAYMTEIVRGGILSVDKGQLEAAASLGMPRLLAMRRIVLPQALRVIVPPVGNEFIGLLKTSSMASAIAYTEILQVSQGIYFVNGKVIELLIVAACWYLVAVTLLTAVQGAVEARLASGQGHDAPESWLARLRRNLRTTRPAAGGTV